MNKPQLVISVFSVILVFLLTGINGCNKSTIINYTPIENTGGEDYQSFESWIGYPHFSFEYPSFYNLTNVNAMPYFSNTSLLLYEFEYLKIVSFPSPEDPDRTVYQQIDTGDRRVNEIEVNIVPYLEDVKTKISQHVNDYQLLLKTGTIEDLKILLKREVVVAGIKGWEIAFSFSFVDKGLNEDDPDYNKPGPAIYRYLYFEHNKMLWGISSRADAVIDERVKTSFEHILRTFKILE